MEDIDPSKLAGPHEQPPSASKPEDSPAHNEGGHASSADATENALSVEAFGNRPLYTTQQNRTLGASTKVKDTTFTPSADQTESKRNSIAASAPAAPELSSDVSEGPLASLVATPTVLKTTQPGQEAPQTAPKASAHDQPGRVVAPDPGPDNPTAAPDASAAPQEPIPAPASAAEEPLETPAPAPEEPPIAMDAPAPAPGEPTVAVDAPAPAPEEPTAATGTPAPAPEEPAAAMDVPAPAVGAPARANAKPHAESNASVRAASSSRDTGKAPGVAAPSAEAVAAEPEAATHTGKGDIGIAANGSSTSSLPQAPALGEQTESTRQSPATAQPPAPHAVLDTPSSSGQEPAAGGTAGQSNGTSSLIAATAPVAASAAPDAVAQPQQGAPDASGEPADQLKTGSNGVVPNGKTNVSPATAESPAPAGNGAAARAQADAGDGSVNGNGSSNAAAPPAAPPVAPKQNKSMPSLPTRKASSSSTPQAAAGTAAASAASQEAMRSIPAETPQPPSTSGAALSAPAGDAAPAPPKPRAMPSLPPKRGAAADGPSSASGAQPPQKGKAMPVLPPKPNASRRASDPPPTSKGDAGTEAGASSSSGSSFNFPSAAGLGSSASASDSASAPSTSTALVPQRAAPALGGAAAAQEDEQTRRLRRQVHDLRVVMMRAALRLGWEDHYVHQVMYRLQFAENLQLPKQRGSGPRLDPVKMAHREAQRLETEQGGSTPLQLKMRIMLVGLVGSGKTALGHAVLRHNAPMVAEEVLQPTAAVQVLRGLVAGIDMEIIDTPGLHPNASRTFQNLQAVKQIRRAYRKHTPDAVLYVDRLDRRTADDDEAAALRLLTSALGPAAWCNTILAFSHCGCQMPAGPDGKPLPWQMLAKQREHALQVAIRTVSGDMRLMNPVVWVESRIVAAVNDAGQPLIFDGHPWRQHLYLMLISAKVLSDCEIVFGLQSAQQQPAATAMAPPQPPPLGFVLSQMLAVNEAAKFPNHKVVQELWAMKEKIKETSHPKRKKALARELKAGQRQLRFQERYQRTLMKSQVDRVIHPPGLRSVIDPRLPHRYAAAMATDQEGMACSGTIARPQVDNRLTLDHCDGIVGITVERSSVLFPGEHIGPQISLSGLPCNINFQGQCSKERFLVQARGEVAAYHDHLERHVTGITLDTQTSGSVAARDTLYTMQVDRHMKSVLGPDHITTAGLLVSRFGEGGRPTRGPLSLGARLQDRWRLDKLLRLPVLLGVCLGAVAARPQQGVAVTEQPLEKALGANVELKVDLNEGAKSGVPLSVGVNVLKVKGELATAANASLQWKMGKTKFGASTQVMGSKGRLRLRVHTRQHYVLGLLAVMPLLTNLYEWVMTRLRNKQRPERVRKQPPTQQQQQQQ